ncbi:hypothetical protein [Cohnella laeviribosi]|uniref:hypothetical protein n=1 Tax=Cohnella laeviribosi TaxID=380174 RepID=UPI003D233DA5
MKRFGLIPSRLSQNRKTGNKPIPLLWLLPLLLAVLYTFFHYGTLNVTKIDFLHPFQGAYIVYSGWFAAGVGIEVARCLKKRKM